MSQRNLNQNALIQSLCRQMAGAMKVLVNGEPVLLSSEDMRHFLAACYKKEAKRLALSPEGDAVILLGASTRAMTKEEASEFIEYIRSIAALKGIRLIEPREEHE